MLAVRHGLRGGRLWVDHSWEFRNREDLLIPPAQWKKERQRLISALSLTREVYDERRPSDADLLVLALDVHEHQFGRAPRLVAADAGFFSAHTKPPLTPEG